MKTKTINQYVTAYDYAQDCDRLRLQADNLLDLDLRVFSKTLHAMPRRNDYRVLDVGCAHGYAARTRLPRLGVPFQCLGVDICAEAITQATSEQEDERFQYECISLEALSPETHGLFDIVFAAYVLHHLPDPATTLQRLWDLLHPGGALIVRGIDDDMRSLDPPNPDLELLLDSTRSLARGTDRHFGRRMHGMLLNLCPLPDLTFMDYKVDSTGGLDEKGRHEYYENALSFRAEYARRMLDRSDASDAERTLAVEVLQAAARLQALFAHDKKQYVALVHSVAVALKQ
ncbi:MAG: methyltransferase domain-containing protein [Desulfovibrionaceae bacterium]